MRIFVQAWFSGVAGFSYLAGHNVAADCFNKNIWLLYQSVLVLLLITKVLNTCNVDHIPKHSGSTSLYYDINVSYAFFYILHL